MTERKTYQVRLRTTCRICDGADLIPYLDLGEHPPSNDFLSPEQVEGEVRFPLKVALCTRCGLSQLTHVIAAADIFDDPLRSRLERDALAPYLRRQRWFGGKARGLASS